MLRRHPLNRKDAFYFAGDVSKLRCLARIPVVPGMSVNGMFADILMETGTTQKTIISGGEAFAHAFYVPYRLVDAGFPDRLVGDTAPLALSTTADNNVYERRSGTNVYARRSAKLIYNQYYGLEGSGEFYGNIEDDAAASDQFNLKVTDDFLSGLTLESQVSDATYLAPVAGANATVNLRDFRNAMRDSVSRVYQQATGDKYVDVLRSMGVDPGWSIQMAPEFLGGTKKWTRAQYSRSTAGENVGQSYGRFTFQLSLELKQSKFFAEHGTIMIMGGIRFDPFFMTADAPINTVPYDSLDNGPEAWYRANVDLGGQNYNTPAASIGNGLYGASLRHLRHGSHLYGTVGSNNDARWFIDHEAGAQYRSWLYPRASQSFVGIPGAEYACHTRLLTKGQIPISERGVN